MTGANVVLECNVDGTPRPSIIWKFNGKIMDPYFNRFSDDGMKLMIDAVDYLNAGQYKCEVENRAGSDEIVHVLDVLIPPKISAVKNQEHVIHGQSAVLRCLADGIPFPEISWYKDGAPITNRSRDFDIRQNGEELFIHYASNGNSGSYKCVALSDIGEDEAFITLNVFKLRCSDYVSIFVTFLLQFCYIFCNIVCIIVCIIFVTLFVTFLLHCFFHFCYTFCNILCYIFCNIACNIFCHNFCIIHEFKFLKTV